MDVVNIIKKAVYSPLDDLKGWGIVAAVSLIIGILTQLGILYTEYSSIFNILSLIVSIILMGIVLAIIKDTINGGNQVPMIDPVKNFLDGIKYIIVEVVYYVIPAVIVFLISIVAGVYSNTEKFIIALNTTNMVNATPANLFSTVPADVTNALFISIAVVAILAFVLFILFALFLIIAQVRLAETESILEAINVMKVIDKISSIGWANYILFIILLFILIFVVGLIMGLITLIPYVGAIISNCVCGSFLSIVIARAIGLIYLEG